MDINYSSYYEIYSNLLNGDRTFLQRKLGTNDYPIVGWMIEYFSDKEEYDKCYYLRTLKLDMVDDVKLFEEKNWINLNFKKIC